VAQGGGGRADLADPLGPQCGRSPHRTSSREYGALPSVTYRVLRGRYVPAGHCLALLLSHPVSPVSRSRVRSNHFVTIPPTPASPCRATAPPPLVVGVAEGRLLYFDCTRSGADVPPTYRQVPDSASPFKAFDGIGTDYVPLVFDVNDDVSAGGVTGPVDPLPSGGHCYPPFAAHGAWWAGPPCETRTLTNERG
jgi:hypothetical protein